MVFARTSNKEMTPAERAIYAASTIHRRRLISLARRPESDPAIDPEDTVQDALESTYRNRDHIESQEKGGHPDAYIKSGVARKSIDPVRHQRMRERHGERQLEAMIPLGRDVDSLPVAQFAPDTADVFIQQSDEENYISNMRQAITAAVNKEKLSPLERELLMGLYRDDKSYTQLDTELKLKPGSAKSKLLRARNKLRKNKELKEVAESLGFKKS